MDDIRLHCLYVFKLPGRQVRSLEVPQPPCSTVICKSLSGSHLKPMNEPSAAVYHWNIHSCTICYYLSSHFKGISEIRPCETFNRFNYFVFIITWIYIHYQSKVGILILMHLVLFFLSFQFSMTSVDRWRNQIYEQYICNNAAKKHTLNNPWMLKSGYF